LAGKVVVAFPAVFFLAFVHVLRFHAQSMLKPCVEGSMEPTEKFVLVQVRLGPGAAAALARLQRLWEAPRTEVVRRSIQMALDAETSRLPREQEST
jgi:hypothetical protein